MVIIAGSPPGIPGSTNALRIHRMGDAINEVAPAYRTPPDASALEPDQLVEPGDAGATGDRDRLLVRLAPATSTRSSASAAQLAGCPRRC